MESKSQKVRGAYPTGLKGGEERRKKMRRASPC